MIPPHDGSDDETTVLPPVGDAPELVRPYVQAVGTESAARWQPIPEPDREPGTEADTKPVPGPKPVRGAEAVPGPKPVRGAEAVPVPESDTNPVPGPESQPGPDTLPITEVAPEPAGATAVLPATATLPAPTDVPRDPEPPRRGGRKGWALAGGAVLLILVGTGAALLTQSSGDSPVASSSPSRTGVSPSAATSVAVSASASVRPTPSHSVSPSPSHSAKPSPTVRPTPKPSPSATRPSPSAGPSVSPSGGTQGATLQLGSTGPAVVTLQQDLRALWIDRGLQPSGTYDQRTEQDVASFQVWYGVQGDPSGVYGPNSQAKMAQLMASRGNNGGGRNNGG